MRRAAAPGSGAEELRWRDASLMMPKKIVPSISGDPESGGTITGGGQGE